VGHDSWVHETRSSDGRSVIFRKKDGQSGRAANATLRIPRLTTRAWLRSKLLNETVLDDPCPAVKAPVERALLRKQSWDYLKHNHQKKVASLIVHKF
jgi:hypothetical protein